MSKVNRDRLLEHMIGVEGQRTELYADEYGNQTIGIGRNLTSRGITKKESVFLFWDDIQIIEAELDARALWWRGMSEGVQLALIDMAFMGVPKLMGFKKMISALQNGLYQVAASEALDSKWAREDVSFARSHDVAQLLSEG